MLSDIYVFLCAGFFKNPEIWTYEALVYEMYTKFCSARV